MVKNLKLGSRLISLALATSIAFGVSGCTSKFKDEKEIERVKTYLEDFMTEEGYVDLSNISTDYEIYDFDGKYLKLALEEMNVEHVRITDSYVFNGDYVDGFPVMLAFNYNKLLGYDDNGEPVYETYDPIRMSGPDGVIYYYPKGFTLKEVDVLVNPVFYNQLEDREVSVKKQDDSYTLSLNKK